MSEIKKLTADIDVGEYYEKYVDFEEVSKLCIEEEEMLGYNWNYPPFEFDVDEVWNSYNKLKIIAFKIDFSEEELAHTFEEKELEFILKRFERMKVKFMNEIYMLEDENSLGLFLGKCNLTLDTIWKKQHFISQTTKEILNLDLYELFLQITLDKL